MDNSLIKRQAAIDALDVLCQEHRYKIPGKRETYSQYNEAWQDALDRAECAIGSLPSAQPERGRWVPCSERLPDKEGMYLCTVGANYRNPREMIYAPDSVVNNEDSNTWRSTDGHRVFNWFVIAWKPMPEPYKMDEEG